MNLSQNNIDELESRGIKTNELLHKARNFSIDIGDWCVLSPINRFRNTPASTGAKNTQEKIEDIAALKKHTGLIGGITANSFGLLNDYPLNKINEYKNLLESNNLFVTSVQPNATKNIHYMDGSISNLDKNIRNEFFEHVSESLEVAKVVNAKVLNLWFGDGTNYPGTTIFSHRINQVQNSLKQIYEMTPETMGIHLEYKFFEPANYHTDIADWGSALFFAESCGERMKVLVDTGHHPLGTNIEYIVSLLLSKSKMGSIHINSKKYADDDLNAGAINPYELFLIIKELTSPYQNPGYCFPTITLDEFHYTKPPILGVLQSILYIEQLYLKSLLINWDYLESTIANQDYAKAENHIHEAYLFDVSPFIHQVRIEKGLSPRSFHDFYQTNYYRTVIVNRLT